MGHSVYDCYKKSYFPEHTVRHSRSFLYILSVTYKEFLEICKEIWERKLHSDVCRNYVISVPKEMQSQFRHSYIRRKTIQYNADEEENSENF